jgi:hypothetical protein
LGNPCKQVGSGDRKRGRGRNEQQRSDERASEDGGGLTGSGKRSEHGKIPFFKFIVTRPSGHASFNAGSVPNAKCPCFSTKLVSEAAKLLALNAASWENPPSRPAIR